jgi:hypothetical protein
MPTSFFLKSGVNIVNDYLNRYHGNTVPNDRYDGPCSALHYLRVQIFTSSDCDFLVPWQKVIQNKELL